MKTVWYNEKQEKNSYAEFITRFTYSGKTCKLRISASSEYAVYLNGEFVCNGQYPDYPFYKVADEIDLTARVRSGENLLAVAAYHDGLNNSSVYYPKPAGVAYEVVADGKVLAESDDTTFARRSPVFGSGEIENITNQLGYSYRADLRRADEWITTGAGDGFAPAVVTVPDYDFQPRPIKKCELLSPAKTTAVQQGFFVEHGGDIPSLKMQNALLGFKRFSDMTGKEKIGFADKPNTFTCADGDGIYVVYDAGRETVGYLDFDITLDEDAVCNIAFGEHLCDGRVRAEVGLRNFAFSVTLKKGRNKFFNPFRRLGFRYLQICIYAHKATIDKFTVREYVYPVTEKRKKFQDEYIRRLYSTGVRTLRLCMHEHYEDCPWREQALYAMDSRNQMLFGYGAFGEYEYPRAALKTIALSIDDDGLLSLCSPAKMNITIPVFSLFFVIALYENAKVDFDKAFVAEMLPYAEKVVSVFADRLTEYGVSSFVGTRYWNFYEWSEGLDGGEIFKKVESEPSFDFIPTAVLSVAAKYLSELELRLGAKAEAARYKAVSARAKAATESFYCAESGLYYSFIKNGEKQGLHEYSLAMAVYAGVGRERSKKIAETLAKKDARVTPCTPAALSFYYDAIIRYARNGLSVVWQDIADRYGKLLYSESTSLWETDLGEADFGEAGSLCHGWSAVPCYIYDKYGYKRIAERESNPIKF